MKYSTILAQSTIFIIVLVSYGFLYKAGSAIPLLEFGFYLPRVFLKLVKPAYDCEALPAKGYLAIKEQSEECQLNLESFGVLCDVLGVPIIESELKLLYDILDLSGNGRLSWGEVSIDYFNASMGALEYYSTRIRLFRDTLPFGGLYRVNANYEKYS